MKPVIIPVENGKITLTLADFRKYMEEAYNQGYSDGNSANSLTNAPYTNPYWWRDPWYATISTTDTASDTTAALKTNRGTDNFNITGSVSTSIQGE